MIFDLGLLFTNHIYSYYTIAIICFVIQLSLILLYLTDWKSSFYRLILIWLFLVVLFIYFLLIFDSVLLGNIVCNIGDVNNEIGTKVNVSGHVHVNDGEAGKSLANHVGIVGGMGVGVIGVGRAVARAPIPPLAKAGVVLVGAAVGGVVEKIINNSGNVGTNSTSSINNRIISKLIDGSQVSVLQENFFLQMIFYLGCLYLISFLVTQLIFKLYFKDSVTLDLSRFLGANLNSKLEYYLNKIILLNKRMSIFWMWFGILVIMYLISRFSYANYLMRAKIDDAINAHISLHPIKDNLHFTDGSLEEMLLYLQWGNYMCLVTLICLTVILLFRFHFNKNISAIYIWLLMVLLIVTLTYSAYISGDLYTNLDSYVYTYYNIEK